MDPQQEISDQALIQAMRKRILDEIARRSDAEKIVNNVYGGSIGGSGVMDRLGGADQASPDDNSYFVDILRQNYEPGDEAEMVDPNTGMPVKKPLPHGGWAKRVHRFSAPKKKVME